MGTSESFAGMERVQQVGFEIRFTGSLGVIEISTGIGRPAASKAQRETPNFATSIRFDATSERNEENSLALTFQFSGNSTRPLSVRSISSRRKCRGLDRNAVVQLGRSLNRFFGHCIRAKIHDLRKFQSIFSGHYRAPSGNEKINAYKFNKCSFVVLYNLF